MDIKYCTFYASLSLHLHSNTHSSVVKQQWQTRRRHKHRSSQMISCETGLASLSSFWMTRWVCYCSALTKDTSKLQLQRVNQAYAGYGAGTIDRQPR